MSEIFLENAGENLPPEGVGAASVGQGEARLAVLLGGKGFCCESALGLFSLWQEIEHTYVCTYIQHKVRRHLPYTHFAPPPY